LASQVVKLMKEEPVDIIDLKGDMPRGLAVELISFDALKRINKVGREERHREHVTYYAYEYKDEFSRVDFKVPPNRLHSNLRITVDTKEDYQLCREVANHFNDPLVSSTDVVRFLLDNPEIAN